MSNSDYQNKDSCQYAGYFYYSKNLNLAAQNPRLGRMQPAGSGLDIPDLKHLIVARVSAGDLINKMMYD